MHASGLREPGIEREDYLVLYVIDRQHHLLPLSKRGDPETGGYILVFILVSGDFLHCALTCREHPQRLPLPVYHPARSSEDGGKPPVLPAGRVEGDGLRQTGRESAAPARDALHIAGPLYVAAHFTVGDIEKRERSPGGCLNAETGVVGVVVRSGRSEAE